MDETTVQNDAKDLSEEPGEKDDKHFESLYSKVMNMTVSEKIKLATTGNKEARNLLIKDSNKVVVEAVINSPKLAADEAVLYAGDKNLPSDVPRLISKKKEYIKNYNVKLALIKNPKTPMHITMSLMGHLRESDLKNIAKNKNVPSVITTAARKRLSSKGR